jgi:hypothetical protein
MKWTDDITGATIDRRRMNLQMAFYARLLGTGDTLICRTIKVATIQQYLRAVARFLASFDPKERDYRRVDNNDKHFAPPLAAVLAELKRWETVPDRREPFTLEMLAELQQQTIGTSPDGIFAACCDWFLIGLYQGLRRSEWAQPSANAALGTHQRDIFHETKAFTINDFTFETTSRQRLVGAEVLQVPPTSVQKLFIRYRTQKNGNNGEIKLVTCPWDPETGNLNAVNAAISIIARHVRLRGTCDTTTPLAIFRTVSGHVKHITDSIAETVMRNLAMKVYNLDRVKHKAELQRWSCHSLRVGACVILHSTGSTVIQIQFILRWRSYAFMAYLRNTAILANHQYNAMTTIAQNPQLI